ncbi:enoyl-CoA hydratase-related protein [Ferrovibrio sp.]|uniref:enoyl-CoA hydratase-related protein n=1 Tax=Ferrovibrio sp. TaxID=1917215 RepID=UPI003D14A18A
MRAPPTLKEFRLETIADGIGHLIFDMPGRSMNVFSNAAIHESEAIADWLPSSGLSGLLISSGKTTAFCAGADLGELAEAYAMIVAAPEQQRSQVAREHFAPIGRAFRKLETAGVPIAVAIHGLALGGGCEFAMAGHYRVMTNNANTALGLPESLVGLFPGAGGTQRMPRLVGIDAAWPILLDGARLSAAQAVQAGAADLVVPVGEEIKAALAWLQSAPEPVQPWDRLNWRQPDAAEIQRKVTALRATRMADTRGHYPAITAILDCVEHGLLAVMDQAVSIEIDIFAELIKRPEPRDMIRTLFLGKQTYAKQQKTGTLPPAFAPLFKDVADALAAVAAAAGREQAEQHRIAAGFTRPLPQHGSATALPQAALPEVKGIAATGLWVEAPTTDWQRTGARLLAAAAIAAAPYRTGLSLADQQAADFAIVSDLGFPAYLGGPFALLDSVGSAGITKMAAA